MYKLVAAILVGNGVGDRMATAPHYIILSYFFTGLLRRRPLHRLKTSGVNHPLMRLNIPEERRTRIYMYIYILNLHINTLRAATSDHYLDICRKISRIFSVLSFVDKSS